ncbi:MAG: carbamoyltransferase HypF [Chlorobiaceae bacterium]
MSPLEPGAPRRLRLLVNGIVQGVGFRPFVYRLAHRLALSGFIRNTPSGVLIEVEGPQPLIDAFTLALQDEPPPLARIESLRETVLDPLQREGFSIGDSSSGSEVETLIPPDIAICRDCSRELRDPSDRRFRYPFINCTSCGPRYTIVGRLPYDRPFTSMHSFLMCPECAQEYHDPLDRRFHAEPIACPACGPSLSLLDDAGRLLEGGDSMAGAVELLRQGMIVAIKGLGGFHLAVDARNEAAVQRLRERKGREAKPFAVMMRDCGEVRMHALLSPAEEEALNAPEAPIVLLRKSLNFSLAPSVAPGNDRLGVMLPYTPLHLLLFDGGPPALVMTSANFSEEPIVHEPGEAVLRLRGIADRFLMHDRPIYSKCDDSVTMLLSGRLRQLRRSRGYVPAPVALCEDGPVVLGTGGELKNTIALLKGSHALLSQHIGDMKNLEAYSHFEHVAAHLQQLFQASPELIVHDLHPSYMTTSWALKQSMPLLAVQHHHAHLASCLAENRESGPAIGLILDGTGYGTDGTIWGGELLIGGFEGAERFAALEPMPLPGGDAAVLHPWRAAIGYLHRSCRALPDLAFMQSKTIAPLIAPLIELLEKNVAVFETSSCGRLFDAVAAMCGIGCDISYEGQAAIGLMHAAGGRIGEQAFRSGLEPGGNHGALWQMMLSPMVQDAALALEQGMGAGEVSRRFHRTLLNSFLEAIRNASEASGIKTVALSGGVFQNPLLFETLQSELLEAGYQVLTQARVPSNDGGLSLGQAMIGRSYLKGEYKGVR